MPAPGGREEERRCGRRARGVKGEGVGVGGPLGQRRAGGGAIVSERKKGACAHSFGKVAARFARAPLHRWRPPHVRSPPCPLCAQPAQRRPRPELLPQPRRRGGALLLHHQPHRAVAAVRRLRCVCRVAAAPTAPAPGRIPGQPRRAPSGVTRTAGAVASPCPAISFCDLIFPSPFPRLASGQHPRAPRRAARAGRSRPPPLSPRRPQRPGRSTRPQRWPWSPRRPPLLWTLRPPSPPRRARRPRPRRCR